jgi:hypothetical protein
VASMLSTVLLNVMPVLLDPASVRVTSAAR